MKDTTFHLNMPNLPNENSPSLSEQIVLLELQREQAMFEEDFRHVQQIGDRQLEILQRAAGLPATTERSP